MRKPVGVPHVGKVLVGVQVRLAPLAWFARVTTLYAHGADPRKLGPFPPNE